jgi:hypothetical protein
LLRWLRRRRLDDRGRRRLLIALARAEEELIETHVRSALDVIEAVSGEIPVERALRIYLKAFDPGEPRSSIIARGVMTRFELDDERHGPRRRRAVWRD